MNAHKNERSKMANTWITNLRDFLTAEGEIGPQFGPARKLAEYFAKIVVHATTEPWDEPKKSALRCRRRPARKRCAGVIETDSDPDTDAIVWWCPVCGDNGTISDWQGSRWDRTASRTTSGSGEIET
jgi:hypothetical protein